MPTILDKILAVKADEVAAAKRGPAPEPAAQPPRGFARALKTDIAAGGPAIIAEIKKASPSKGLIRADFDAATLARAYTAGGAACLSVLTDAPFFQGSPDNLQITRQSVDLPLLRKDFVIDPIQVAEARAWGADAVLLIVAALDDAALRRLAECIAEAGMDALVEVHDAAELARALALPPALAPIIGINNRNLKTFETTLDTTRALNAKMPEDGRVIVSESGIFTADDVGSLRADGVHAFLVGESLMRQADVTAALKALRGRGSSSRA